MGLVKCKECGEQISRKAKQCPKCGSPQKRTSRLTWLVLILILIVVFGNMTGLIESPPPSAENANSDTQKRSKASYKQQAMTATKLDVSWSKGGFDNVMMANFVITNNSDLKIKDIKIKCTHFGPSGTEIDQNTRTIYELVEAHSKKTISDFNMGIIHSQAHSTRCEIRDLVIASIISN